MTDEKKRAEPFTAHERQVLLECMFNYKDIVECKRNDGTTVANKTKAWEKITLAFNSYVNVKKKSASQLRKAYNNIKARYKKKDIADLCLDRKVTDNGPSRQDQGDPLLEAITPVILHSIEGNFDSDSMEANSQPSFSIEPQSSPAAPANILVETELLSDNVSEDEAIAAQQSVPPYTLPRRRFRRQTEFREDHSLRTEQLRVTLQQMRELHELKMREALAAAEEAEARRDAAREALAVAGLRTQNEEEEFAYQRERRRRLLEKLERESDL